MTRFIEKLRQLLATKKRRQNKMGSKQETAATEPVVDNTNICRLMQLLELTNADNYSCKETFVLLDEYVELIESDAEAEALMPLVKQHLDRCPDCHEQYEMLLRILQEETADSHS